LGACSFIHLKVTEGSQILNFGHMTLTKPTVGLTLMCTIFTSNSKFLSVTVPKIEGPKISKGVISPSHALLQVNCSSDDNVL